MWVTAILIPLIAAKRGPAPQPMTRRHPLNSKNGSKTTTPKIMRLRSRSSTIRWEDSK